MTHTGSEVKTSISICLDLTVECDGCAYQSPVRSGCLKELTCDALEYIMELETEIKQLKEAAQ